MPYVTVLPMTGNQWKTTGGSLGFLNKTWWRTFRKTTAARKPASTTPIREAKESSANFWVSGSKWTAASWSRPMARALLWREALFLRGGGGILFAAACQRDEKKLIGGGSETARHATSDGKKKKAVLLVVIVPSARNVSTDVCRSGCMARAGKCCEPFEVAEIQLAGAPLRVRDRPISAPTFLTRTF